MLGYLPGLPGLPGAAKGAEPRYLVVSAHYDHLGVEDGQIYNGADDNASGVAALLAAARHFRAPPAHHSLVLAAFDAEELGLVGARRSSPRPRAARGDRARRQPRHGGPRRQGRALRRRHRLPPAARGAAPESGRASRPHAAPRPRPPRRCPGDDWTRSRTTAPSTAAGIPFVYFGVEDHPDYHQPTDDFDKIPQGFFVRSAWTILWRGRGARPPSGPRKVIRGSARRPSTPAEQNLPTTSRRRLRQNKIYRRRAVVDSAPFPSSRSSSNDRWHRASSSQ